MKSLLALALILAAVVSNPAFADRQFGTSNHGPAPSIQMEQNGR